MSQPLSVEEGRPKVTQPRRQRDFIDRAFKTATVIHVRARGRWLYTPGEHHGPEGHATYPAPDSYPIPGANIPGGVLLARIGEEGPPQLVGRGRRLVADRFGTLHFRINDDILSDNEGYVTVEVRVEPPSP